MASLPLITPSDCAVVLMDYQAGLAFAAGSADRQGRSLPIAKGKAFPRCPATAMPLVRRRARSNPRNCCRVRCRYGREGTDDAVRKMRRRAPISIL